MKRRRETEKKSSSELRSAIEDLNHHQEINDTHIPIKPFLSLCNFLLHLLDKIGPTMAVLRQDIHQNIQRLEKMEETEPTLYSNVVEILKKEASDCTSRKSTSSSRAFVWLTRSLDFTMKFLEIIAKDFEGNMEEAVEESYKATLKPWHGWISSTAYRVALKLVPDHKTLMDILMEKNDDVEILKEEIQTLASLLLPFLDQIHSILKVYNLDRVKAI